MKKIISILRLDFLPSKPDLALLLLRLWFGGSLLILHGWGKLTAFDKTVRQTPDLFGIGKQATAALSVVGEFFCPALIIFGFFTRFGAVGSAITMGVAFFIVHKGRLSEGELAFVYLGGFLAILLGGAGRYSIDGGKGGGPKKPSTPKPK